MLTRSGVAQRLGRSLATVRRLEGMELFPSRDAQGVHWFDEDEVQDVKQQLERGALRAARGTWLDSKHVCRRNPPEAQSKMLCRSPTEAVAELARENAELKSNLRELEARFAELLEAIDELD
jgi:hypothetical protein